MFIINQVLKADKIPAGKGEELFKHGLPSILSRAISCWWGHIPIKRWPEL